MKDLHVCAIFFALMSIAFAINKMQFYSLTVMAAGFMTLLVSFTDFIDDSKKPPSKESPNIDGSGIVE
ncbi:MAG: hypothetical protein V4478_01415 [Patescibacteria group bacterium]